MKIPEDEYWYIATQGPEAGYVWRMLDILEEGNSFTRPDGKYRFDGEIANGLRVLEWMPNGQQG